MKKLIPALCMLLVAACLMGTSTYAWFAANVDVTATGMQVQAAADGGLAIATYTGNVGSAPSAPADNTFGTTVDAVWSNIADSATIKPTSTSAGVWYSASAKDNESYAADTAYTPVATYATDANDAQVYVDYVKDLGSYAQVTKWQVKSMDMSGENYFLKVKSITVNPGNSPVSADLNKALRVAVYCNGDWFYFAPGQTTGSFNYVGASGKTAYVDEASATASDEFITVGTTPGTTIYNNLTNTAFDVEVYVYYEGEDTNCKTANMFDGVDVLQVSFVFTAAKNLTDNT